MILVLALASLSCSLLQSGAEQTPLPPVVTQALAQPSPTLAPPPSEAPTLVPFTSEPPAQATPSETPAPSPSDTPAAPTVQIGPCEEEVCILPFQFPFSRPIAPPGRDTIDVSYRFGSSDHGKRETHHGVEFLNSSGTPVLAAASGKVVVAGDDKTTQYGLFRNFYGNMVVVQHTLPGFDQPVFTLYGHLSSIDVKVDDTVESGQKIGEVGATGSATGSHLHFEVRYGEDTYAASSNPELWLRPLQDQNGEPMGALAGRILDARDKPVALSNIVVERIPDANSAAREVTYLNTYSEVKLVGLEPWRESFAAGDLPPGQYKISFFLNGMQTRLVEVHSGELTYVTFQIAGQ